MYIYILHYFGVFPSKCLVFPPCADSFSLACCRLLLLVLVLLVLLVLLLLLGEFSTRS